MASGTCAHQSLEGSQVVDPKFVSSSTARPQNTRQKCATPQHTAQDTRPQEGTRWLTTAKCEISPNSQHHKQTCMPVEPVRSVLTTPCAGPCYPPDFFNWVLPACVCFAALPILQAVILCARFRRHGHALAVCGAACIHHMHQHISITQVTQEGISSPTSLVGTCKTGPNA